MEQSVQETPVSRRTPEFCPQLTSARFFAAAVVVLYHFHNEVAPLGPNGETTILRNLVDRGFLGVTFFFILSGYILSLNYLQRFRAGTTSMASFFVARFARIYPLYLLSVLVCLPYVFLDPSKFPHGENIIALRQHPISAATMYLLGAESHWAEAVGKIAVLPTWSISTEFFWYLLFPAFALVICRLNRTQAKIGMILVGTWAFLTAVVFHFCSLADIIFFLPPDRVAIINDFIFQKAHEGIHMNWPLFAFGMLTFKGFEGELSAEIKKYLPWTIGVIALINCAWYAVQPVEFREGLLLMTKNFEGLALFGLLILWLHKGNGKIHTWLGHPKLVVLGEISFALYLVHSPLRLVSRFFVAKPLGIPEASPLFYVPLWGLSLAISWVAWKYVEVPARRAILGAWKQREAKRVRHLAV
jgi:peptidoglycan/LPS O-acetylase OafA/YrhL